MEKEETGVVAIIAFLFFGLMILCGLEFADSMAKDAEEGSGGHGHGHH